MPRTGFPWDLSPFKFLQGSNFSRIPAFCHQEYTEPPENNVLIWFVRYIEWWTKKDPKENQTWDSQDTFEKLPEICFPSLKGRFHVLRSWYNSLPCTTWSSNPMCLTSKGGCGIKLLLIFLIMQQIFTEFLTCAKCKDEWVPELRSESFRRESR